MKNYKYMKPLRNNVLVKELPEETVTSSGIILSDVKSVKSKYKRGEVIALGPTATPELKVGSIVLYDPFGHTISENEILVSDQNIFCTV